MISRSEKFSSPNLEWVGFFYIKTLITSEEIFKAEYLGHVEVLRLPDDEIKIFGRRS